MCGERGEVVVGGDVEDEGRWVLGCVGGMLWFFFVIEDFLILLCIERFLIFRVFVKWWEVFLFCLVYNGLEKFFLIDGFVF